IGGSVHVDGEVMDSDVREHEQCDGRSSGTRSYHYHFDQRTLVPCSSLTTRKADNRSRQADATDDDECSWDEIQVEVEPKKGKCREAPCPEQRKGTAAEQAPCPGEVRSVRPNPDKDRCPDSGTECADP